MKVYLAGNISADPNTYRWRARLTQLLHKLKHVEVLNPCKNAYDQAGLRKYRGNQKAFFSENVCGSSFLLRAKDYQTIKHADLMVANLVLWSTENPAIGTTQELVWAHDIFYIPIIGIVGDRTSPHARHPWIRECLSGEVKNEKEAAKLIREYFFAR